MTDRFKASRITRIAMMRCILTVLLVYQFSSADARAVENMTAETWEFRVCVAPDEYPASSDQRPGFENRIAQLLADQLGARLTSVWASHDIDAIRLHLRTGDCDAVMQVTDGAAGVLSTIPYYQTPYVFLYRKDAGFHLESLDDSILQTLRIATYPFGIPYMALFNRGLAQQLLIQAPFAGASGLDTLTPLLQSLLDRTADVGIVYGPDAGSFAQEHPGEWELVPVTPEIDAQFLEMYRTWTIAVRPGDEALRDRLNIALAERWNEIQAVFTEYNVPLMPLPKPGLPMPDDAPLIRIGIILPLPTGTPGPLDILAESAYHGAILAESLLGASDTGPEIEVLAASSPTADAAQRAAQRLVLTEGVTALIGGADAHQTRVLSDVAEAQHIPLLTIGMPVNEHMQDGACRAHTFSIGASATMYIHALATWFADAGFERWVLVYQNSDEGEELFQLASNAVLGSGGEIAAGLGTGTGYLAYHEELTEIAALAPDIVLVLLDPDEQEFFLSQYDAAGGGFPITGFPWPVTQTRDFFARLLQAAPAAGAGYRVSLWETTLDTDGAGELNERFIGRFGRPMDPPAWAAWAAVKIIRDAAGAISGTNPRALVNYLKDPETVFELEKGPGVSFRSSDHQLRQPLYMLKLDSDAVWSLAPVEMLRFAQLVAEIPKVASTETGSEAKEQLDQLSSPLAGHCQ